MRAVNRTGRDRITDSVSGCLAMTTEIDLDTGAWRAARACYVSAEGPWDEAGPRDITAIVRLAMEGAFETVTSPTGRRAGSPASGVAAGRAMDGRRPVGHASQV